VPSPGPSSWKRSPRSCSPTHGRANYAQPRAAQISALLNARLHLLSVVLPALVAEALAVALRRLAPGLLRCSLGARRRAVEVPSVARTTEEEFPVASRADTTQQLLHEATGARRQIGQRLAARGIHDVGSDAFDVVPCGAELELCVAPLWGGLRDYDQVAPAAKKLSHRTPPRAFVFGATSVACEHRGETSAQSLR